VNLRRLGPRLRLVDETGDDLGFCRAPLPLQVEDVIADERGLYRVVTIVELDEPDDRVVDALVEVVRVGSVGGPLAT
jgi:hypothetical protein